ncbi:MULTISPECIES: hypothetical protein [Streptomyces]
MAQVPQDHRAGVVRRRGERGHVVELAGAVGDRAVRGDRDPVAVAG